MNQKRKKKKKKNPWHSTAEPEQKCKPYAKPKKTKSGNSVKPKKRKPKGNQLGESEREK